MAQSSAMAKAIIGVMKAKMKEKIEITKPESENNVAYAHRVARKQK